jgi:hypothetical protein
MNQESDSRKEKAASLVELATNPVGAPVENALAFARGEEPWRIGSATVVQEILFHSLLDDAGLTEHQLKERLLDVHNIVNDNGWLNPTAVGCLVAYSDELGKHLLEQAPKGAGAEVWDALQVGLAPCSFNGITINQLVCVIPNRLRMNLQGCSTERRPYYALRVVCHEFAHAFGCAYKPGDPHERTASTKFDVLADAVAFSALNNPGVPHDFFRCFFYLLKDYQTTPAARPSNNSLAEHAEKIIRRYRRD